MPPDRAGRLRSGQHRPTPGKVIFRNDLIELIQYAPATPTRLKRPLLIVPPWINKFYILDLNPEKSFIRWAVSQGLTRVLHLLGQPGRAARGQGFRELHARRHLRGARRDRDRRPARTSVDRDRLLRRRHAAVRDAGLHGGQSATSASTSATFFTTQVDFTHAGDLSVFVDEEQIRTIEDKMYAGGYLEGSRMASAFNMLRPNDLDLALCRQRLPEGQERRSVRPALLELRFHAHAGGQPLLLPAQLLSREQARQGRDGSRREARSEEGEDPDLQPRRQDDHIAPPGRSSSARRASAGRFTTSCAGSGHIAGAAQPAAKPKYQFLEPVHRSRGTLEDWTSKATGAPGSWWPHWCEWVRPGPQVAPARRGPGGGKPNRLERNPRTYAGQVLKVDFLSGHGKGERPASTPALHISSRGSGPGGRARQYLRTIGSTPAWQPRGCPSGSGDATVTMSTCALALPTIGPEGKPPSVGVRRGPERISSLREDVGVGDVEGEHVRFTVSLHRRTPRCGRCRADGCNALRCRSASIS